VTPADLEAARARIDELVALAEDGSHAWTPAERRELTALWAAVEAAG
jgi:hypothetical protein